MKRLRGIVLLAVVLAVASGCVYYNTFYYARKAFNEAESKRKEAGRKAGKGGAGGSYNRAADKSQKVLDDYPNSSWYDDALYVNGVSNYYIGDYSKAEKRFRELIANYPKSKYLKDGRLYLAKTKLKMNEESEAMTMFGSLYKESSDRGIRSEAAMALGEYHYDKKEYSSGETYFRALLDSLGNDEEKIVAQMYIADGYYERFNYKSALENYLKILDRNPSKNDRFKATYRAGECAFYLNEIEDGMGYLKQLSDNVIYYDSLATIKLMVAFGYEMDGDLTLAEKTYRDVADNNKRQQGAIANYNLGLIYQFDYEDYKKAKEFYDKAKLAGSSSGIYHDALQRSSDIGKLEEYSKKVVFDSTTTQEEIDAAAKTQYLLAELYLMQLGKPDSALHEFEFVAEKFPEAAMAPKALIAIAVMMRDYYSDTLSFDTTLRRVLKEYPRSDFIPEALDLLGLRGTAADTGYAGSYYHKAEEFAMDSAKYDSAKYYFGIVADSFPRSEFNEQARYALLWLTEAYASPGDSSLYYAYVNFVDSFAKSEYGKAIVKKLPGKTRPVKEKGDEGEEGDEDSTAAMAAVTDSLATDSTQQRTLTPEEKFYIGPDGTKLLPTQGNPLRYDRLFKYPPAAYVTNFEGYLYFQIQIDPFGDVVDYRLMNPTQSDELNQEAIETVKVSHWDTRWIPAQMYDAWFVFKYLVQLPRNLK